MTAKTDADPGLIDPIKTILDSTREIRNWPQWKILNTRLAFSEQPPLKHTKDEKQSKSIEGLDASL